MRNLSMALVCLMTITILMPPQDAMAATRISGVEKQQIITIIIIDSYDDEYGLPVTRRARGEYIGPFPELRRKDGLPPAEGLVPVTIQVTHWDKAEKMWVAKSEYGWAWEKKLPKPKPVEVRYVPSPQPCCRSAPAPAPRPVAHATATHITNVSINVMLRQSTPVAYQPRFPRYCECEGGGRVPYRSYYRHSTHGYWGHSRCNRAMGFGFGRLGGGY